jgi:hypothetical protein
MKIVAVHFWQVAANGGDLIW